MSDTPTTSESFVSVWDAIEPVPGDAAVMKIRAQLLMNLSTHLREWKIPAARGAKRLGVSVNRFNEITNGRITKFTIEDLVALCVAVGLKVEIVISTD